MATMSNINININIRAIFFNRNFSTTTYKCYAKTYVTPKFSRISPKRVNILQKSKDFDWQEKYRRFSLEQAQAIEQAIKFQQRQPTVDINSKEVYKVESILPEMEIYYNVQHDFFAVVHATKKKVALDGTKALIDDVSTQKKAVQSNTFIISEDIKNQINYLQTRDPNCVWTSIALSQQFKIPVEAIAQQTPPTEKQKEAMRYYKIFQSRLATIDKSQHKVYLEKKRYVAFEKMKSALNLELETSVLSKANADANANANSDAGSNAAA